MRHGKAEKRIEKLAKRAAKESAATEAAAAAAAAPPVDTAAAPPSPMKVGQGVSAWPFLALLPRIRIEYPISYANPVGG